MAITEVLSDSGVAELVLSHPPVNAYNIADLHDLAERLRAMEDRSEVKAVLFRAEGRGFCGGGDLKEVQGLPGYEGILGQSSGSYRASLAVAECAVPVIFAIHAYCIGVGVLLAGAADVLIVEDSARFVMAEIDNGATGGAIQASGLMPEKRLRAAMFTCEPIVATELYQYGSVYRLTSAGDLLAEARAVAEVIAAKPPVVVRRAKSSIDASIGRDIRRLYRVEMSYTYELNLLGEAARARQTFLDGERGSYTNG
jgi:enoyl-CoA hydratase/carnithine racemase